MGPTEGRSTVKKGRHRRFEEARALKRLSDAPLVKPCDECGAGADEPCASWCLARVPDDEFDDEYDDEPGVAGETVGETVGDTQELERR
jgi:hypothetical protein